MKFYQGILVLAYGIRHTCPWIKHLSLSGRQFDDALYPRRPPPQKAALSGRMTVDLADPGPVYLAHGPNTIFEDFLETFDAQGQCKRQHSSTNWCRVDERLHIMVARTQVLATEVLSSCRGAASQQGLGRSGGGAYRGFKGGPLTLTFVPLVPRISGGSGARHSLRIPAARV